MEKQYETPEVTELGSLSDLTLLGTKLVAETDDEPKDQRPAAS